MGWFHGAAEFGPRALGNRSLAGLSLGAYVKENLNEFVKHREGFRPFAISVTSERAAKCFEYTPASHFMATLAVARPESARLLEGFLLPGGPRPFACGGALGESAALGTARSLRSVGPRADAGEYFVQSVWGATGGSRRAMLCEVISVPASTR